MVIGLCFVTRDDWDEYCRVCTDISPGLTYEGFVDRTEDYLRQVAREGGRAVKVQVKPAELLAWCRSTGCQVNASSRRHYAALLVANWKDRN